MVKMEKAEEKNNFPYSALVNGTNDFLGRIAYTIYKQNKIEYKEDLAGKNLSEEEQKKDVKTWQDSQCLPQQVELYRTKATKLLEQFVNEMINRKNTELKSREETLARKEKAVTKKEKNIKAKEEKLEKIRGSFWGNVCAGVVASVLYSVFLLIMYFIARYHYGDGISISFGSGSSG